MNKVLFFFCSDCPQVINSVNQKCARLKVQPSLFTVYTQFHGYIQNSKAVQEA